MSKLSAALVAFQAECPSVNFDKKNPHFNSRYASLAAILKTVGPVLARHGLAAVQFPVSLDGKVGCTTRIVHESGESMEGTLLLPLTKNDPQGAGSAITYARRYGLSGALGIAVDDDDDGNVASASSAAVERPMRQAEPRAAKGPAMSAANREKLKFACRERMKELTGDAGTAEDMTQILKDVAVALARGGPKDLTDGDFGKALEHVQKWEPAS